jgi:GT2 family glycosyltransferase
MVDTISSATREKCDNCTSTNNIGVVVVNWNSFDVLKRCLSALKNQSVTPTITVVIDNNSANAPSELTCDAPDNTHYVQLDRNTGFAHANNYAVAMLKECGWIALINPDAFPEPDWLEMLIDAAVRKPEFTYFASMTIIADEPDYLDGAGDVYHISGIGWRRGYERHIASADIKEEEVFAPCAAAAMYRRDAWEEVGGFDEDFFCYFEDVDLAFRMKLMGHRCLFVPSAVAYHIGSITSGGEQSDFSVYHGHRNLVWTYIKDMPGYAFWLFLPLHIVMNVVTVGWFVVAGRGRVILRAKWDALKGVKKAWRKRRSIQAKRKASVTDVIRFMDKRMIPVRRPGKKLAGKHGSLHAVGSGSFPLHTVRDVTDEQAEYFDYLKHRSLLGLLYRKYYLYPRLVRQLTGRVLDVGCGIGDFLAYRPNTIGVDVNAYAVDWCQSRGLDARLMEAGHLPFDDASFDGVALDNVLEHLSEPVRLLAEIRRVLTPGGHVLVGVPGTFGYTCDADHKIFYDESNLRQLMESAGLKQNTVFYMPIKWDWLDAKLPQYCLYGVFERS